MEWLRTYCRMGQRVIGSSKVKALRAGAVAKASLNRAIKLLSIDPKQYELPMGRMNPTET